ncbi:heat shock 70 kDa protein 12B-like isoform X3 [Dreissena polymorpha]|nr:heat shock 70 kDa protein 12B-like isoform X3 [Dreissena polymorpha]
MPRRQNPNDNETEQGELSHQRVNTGNDSHNNEELRDHQMSPQPEFQLPYQENEPDFFNCKRLVVAAIDIGTTYSCYAYSFSDEFQRDRLQIYANSDWNDGTGMVTCKAPTIVLFDKSGKFHSFGYEAETKYNSLAATDEHIGWRYFRRFKMELFKKTIRRDIKIKDAQEKFMPAIEVFTAAIAFLKNHLLKRLQQRDTGFRETDIDWVLTVPAIWNDAAKQFMIMAAGQAGISENQLSLAYEPEAAAIYCKESFTTLSRELNTKAQLIPFGPGDKFMVIDLGGGTVDITAHEVLADGKLKSLSPPSGGPWGGTVVDKHFNAFIENLFEKDVYKEFSIECASDKLDLDRTIEIKKRAVKPTDEKIMLKLPNELFSFYNEKTNKNIEETLRKGPFKDTVTKKRDRLIVESGKLLAMFNESKNEILAHVEKLLRKRELWGLKKLLLVGGFAESQVIQDAVRQKFDGGYEVMVPQQPELAIVKGAVIYGHLPQSICSRKMPFAYGISTSVRFDPGKHSEVHKCIGVRGEEKCEDLFKAFVKKGDNLLPDQKSAEQSFTSPNPGDQQVTVEIYKSDQDPPPMYVTDCKKVGELVLVLTSVDPNEKALIVVQMAFGGTEVMVEAKESGQGGKRVLARFDWLK